MATPKAIIHKKYGAKAVYKTEEIVDTGEKPLPGLVITRQTRIQYQCTLELPDLTVSSGMFSKKKDAEQSAAQIAMDKLGLQEKEKNPAPEEAFNELIKRLNILFTDEFFSSNHPLVGHLISSLKRNGTDNFTPIPVSAISTCDTKVNTLCKIINPNCEKDPLLTLSLISKAVKASDSLSSSDNGFWVWNLNLFTKDTVKPLLSCQSASESVQVRVLKIPSDLGEEVEGLRIDLRDDGYYLDQIAKVLGVDDTSHILISRTVGKASSEMRFYCAAPESLLSSSLDNYKGCTDSDAGVNKRASYLSGQTIYGNAILANIGHTWRSVSLFYEDMSLCTYYRMLLSRLPDGHYKQSRNSILVSSLPFSYNRPNWRGPSPKEILFSFCRSHRLSEPVFSLKKVTGDPQCKQTGEDAEKESGSAAEGDRTGGPSVKVPRTGDLQCDVKLAKKKEDVLSEPISLQKVTGDLRCEVKIMTKREEPLIICCLSDAYKKESEAIQNSSLKVLKFFKEFFDKLESPVEKLTSFGNLQIYPENILREFSTWINLYSKSFVEKPDEIPQNGVVLSNIVGNDSGVFPSIGSLVTINYEVYLVKESDSNFKHLVERNEEFEFEIGSGSVIPQIESCISQISVDQSAKFTLKKLPSEYIILAASDVSEVSLDGCWLEYNVKLIKVLEPMEERMEKAFFTPPLSKQRVLFAVNQINNSNAYTLVDFGCGSGSLLDSLLDHNTCLKQIIGVDISIKALTRAAKVLHQKLSKNCAMQACLKSAVLYDGSITDFDARLYNLDISTCLEVIEHMEEDQAHLFGDIALSLFSPKILIVSTPNYEYNPILQRSNKEEDSEEKEKDKSAPCKFRNFDHKFEWTRNQFEIWANNLALKHDYSVEFSGVGGSGEIEPGFASQIAVFKRKSDELHEFPELHELQGIGLQGNGLEKKFEVVWEWEGNDKKNDV